jgi:hypothetical protein
MPLAKLGAVAIDNQNAVLICGGMTEPDFEAISDVYYLDMSAIKWSKKAKMNAPRLISSGLFYSNGYAYVVGGDNNGVCERYDFNKN